MAEAMTINRPDDARLLALLEETWQGEAEYEAAWQAACRTKGADPNSVAPHRLTAALAAMAETPAESLLGAVAKAARICRSLRDGGSLRSDEEPLAESLAADLARLAPEVRA